MEPLAEGALVIGELDDGQRRFLRAEHGEAFQVQLGLDDLFLLSLRRLGLLPFEQLADLAQLVQNLVGLLARDALVLGGILRAERQQKRQRQRREACISEKLFHAVPISFPRPGCTGCP